MTTCKNCGDGMRRCTRCDKLKDVNEFTKFGDRRHSWCKQCQLKSTRARRKVKKTEKLAEEKIEKIKQALLRKEVLSLPSFIYQNGYTLNIVPLRDQFKIEICDGQEEVAVLLPADRTELLKDWLAVKLKE